MSKDDNKRGFTMVELLATVVILGILAGVGIPLVYRYLDKARNNSYNHMLTGAYDAANNKIIADNLDCSDDSKCTFELLDLVDEEYLENLDDPAKHGDMCDGLIKVSSSSSSGLKSYNYSCYLECSSYSTAVKWENGAAADDYKEIPDELNKLHDELEDLINKSSEDE